MKTIIFDMDGVLIDTEKYLMKYWCQAAEEFGCPLTYEQALELRSLNHRAAETYFKILFGDRADYHGIRNRRKKLMKEQLEQFGIEKKPYAAEALKELKRRGFCIALATATDYERAYGYLQQIGLEGYFDRIIGASMVAVGKPEPDIYLYACKQLGKKPEECFAVEDSPNGVRSAYRAGCKVVMIPDLTQPDEELKPLLWKKADTLQELLLILQEQPQASQS